MRAIPRVMKKLPQLNRPGYFGEYGGRYVPETLMPPLLEVENALTDILPSAEYQSRLSELLAEYCGRPTPITFCDRLSKELVSSFI